MVGDIVYHLDDVYDPHERLFHLLWVFQVDGVTGLLNGPQELGIVCSLHVVLDDLVLAVPPDLKSTL